MAVGPPKSFFNGEEIGTVRSLRHVQNLTGPIQSQRPLLMGLFDRTGHMKILLFLRRKIDEII